MGLLAAEEGSELERLPASAIEAGTEPTSTWLKVTGNPLDAVFEFENNSRKQSAERAGL